MFGEFQRKAEHGPSEHHDERGGNDKCCGEPQKGAENEMMGLQLVGHGSIVKPDADG